MLQRKAKNCPGGKFLPDPKYGDQLNPEHMGKIHQPDTTEHSFLGERNRRRRCQVAFSYMPQNDDELELKVGDIIEVMGEVEEGWWEGILNGKTGMFPSNFIKELSVDSDDVEIAQEEQLIKPRKSAFHGTVLYRVAQAKIDSYRRYNSLRDATGSESDGGDSSSTKSEGANGAAAIQPKKVKGIGFGDIFKDKPIKLRPRSIEVENDFPPVEKSVSFRKTFNLTLKISSEYEAPRHLIEDSSIIKFLFPKAMGSLVYWWEQECGLSIRAEPKDNQSRSQKA
ncbi:SH3 domain-containing kinase-binding protein 1 [Chelonia mydas]|uniref:SH3 domain-containing kinase-binding protein 1 n=1 Tax=Chelonia mydas TaxID=8469 RepID=M7B0R8_CHEMY|nr:SH3 domain-containing kinase-binding protein 1 [Chelonia mydas]